MMTLHFENVQAWQRSRELARQVYAVTETGPLAAEHELRAQMRLAAISVMTSIAAGFERGGRTLLIEFLSMAKGHTAELESQLYLALDRACLPAKEFKALRELTAATRDHIRRFIKHLQNPDFIAAQT